MLNLKIEAYNCLCALKTFEINGQDADTDDFGESQDLNPSQAPKYGCGNKTFVRAFPTQEVLDKYSISLEEYDNITEALVDALSFGYCALCT